jgi:CRP-like cAMP-binding protein
MTHTELVASLKRITLFKAVDEDFFDKVIPALKLVTYKAGQKIIVEGDTGSAMYFLLRGTVRVSQKTLSGEEYTVVILKDSFGIFFGEIALLSDDKRSASVIAETSCELATLERNAFYGFIDTYPTCGVKLLKELSLYLCSKLIKANRDTIVLYEALIGEIGESFL